MTIPEVTRSQPPLQPPTTPVEPKVDPFQQFIFQAKQKATWAWNATVENAKTASEALKRFLQRVLEAARTFFAPKIEEAKKSLREMSDHLSLKIGARVYRPQIDTLKKSKDELDLNLKKANQERDTALRANRILTQENMRLQTNLHESLQLRDTLQQQLNAFLHPEAPVIIGMPQPPHQPAPHDPIIIGEPDHHQEEEGVVVPEHPHQPQPLPAPQGQRGSLFNLIPGWLGGGGQH